MTRFLILTALFAAATLPPVLLWNLNGAVRIKIDVPVRVVKVMEIRP